MYKLVEPYISFQKSIYMQYTCKMGGKLDWYKWKRRFSVMLYIGVIFTVFVLFVFELKHYYKINIFPSINGPLDDVYFKLKDKLFN